MFRQVMRWVLGEKLENTQLSEQKFNVFWGMPLLSSDAISSVAYAVEEMLWILFPVIGAASYLWTPRIAGIIILLLFILTFSYRQTVAAYPNGGGSYIVASDNLGHIPGLVAGASLATDYILTVSVSICAGTAAIVSAFPQYPQLYHYRVLISLGIVLFMLIGNLRGIKESSRIFSIPTYAFIFAILGLVGAGIFKFFTGHFTGQVLVPIPAVMPHATLTQAAMVFLVLRAFSSGCAALTGVEAISNGVPNFEPPSSKRAQHAYLLLGAAVFLTFGGVAYIAQIYHTVPDPQITVTAQLAYDVFGRGWMFYVVQVTTMIILAMAANTAFADFPMLFSVIAQDRYAPRQLALRGHRLNFSNGVLVLAVLASLLIIIFRGDTNLLIPLYAVGVFTAFTLSQTGMFVHWLKLKTEGWRWKAAVNGLGGIMTFVTVIIIAVTKFMMGAWIVILLIPLIILMMLRIRRHYSQVAQRLDIPNENLGRINLEARYSHHVIIPIDSLNAMVVNALRYAKSVGPNVEAFHVETYIGEADKLRRKWELLNTDIPLIVKHSPYREVVGPLIEYIESEEHASQQGDMITVLLPQFIVKKWWDMVLHNNTSIFIANALFRERNIVVSVLPFSIDDLGEQRRQEPQSTTPAEPETGSIQDTSGQVQ
ncbi:MAG: APC family permease [Thermacetogeniaceae bacterium]